MFLQEALRLNPRFVEAAAKCSDLRRKKTPPDLNGAIEAADAAAELRPRWCKPWCGALRAPLPQPPPSSANSSALPPSLDPPLSPPAPPHSLAPLGPRLPSLPLPSSSASPSALYFHPSTPCCVRVPRADC